jgi:hypothetical protein
MTTTTTTNLTRCNRCTGLLDTPTNRTHRTFDLVACDCPAHLRPVTRMVPVADLKGGDALLDGTHVFDAMPHAYRANTVTLRVVDTDGRVVSHYLTAGTLVAVRWR